MFLVKDAIKDSSDAFTTTLPRWERATQGTIFHGRGHALERIVPVLLHAASVVPQRQMSSIRLAVPVIREDHQDSFDDVKTTAVALRAE
jgi:hypothetical protein